jgi:mannose-6-phosphate isomerase-like protein (cupin superfamily)
MRYVRPFDPQALVAGETSSWVVAPEEATGCAIRLRRGGGEATMTSAAVERFALVLEGEATLENPSGKQRAAVGSLIFIPAQQPGCVSGDAHTCWIDIEAPATQGTTTSQVIKVDPTRFEGEGFAYQSLADRTMGAQSMRLNVLQVQPGSGSPDFHIHAFAQLYVILEGEMTLDIGRARLRAARNSVVCLPAGVVHRNFNASSHIERHVSLLVPEPAEGEIFDFAVHIEDKEAALLQAIPA